MTREISSLQDALTLLDEWIAAHRDLDSQWTRAHHAVIQKLGTAERENHRLYAQLCGYWASEAAAALANEEIEVD